MSSTSEQEQSKIMALPSEASLKRPAAVTGTAVIFGILSFLMFALPIGTEDPTGLASLIPKVVFTAAFIGSVSGTVGGRRVAIGVMLLLQIGAAFGFLAAIRQLPHSVVGAAATAVLSALPVAWFYWYVLGASSRVYFATLREESLRVVANISDRHDDPDEPGNT